jgi:FG-GAP-like repeat/RTX calcium-binding nonapeptide repeat (4 copies)
VADFVANSSFDVYSLNFAGFFFGGTPVRALLPNANVQLDGLNYPDQYRITNYRTGADFQFSLFGANLTVDAQGLVNGGIVARLQEVDQATSQLRWSLSGVQIRADAILFAAQTNQNFDDLALFSTALAGDDRIVLSSFSDTFNAYSGNDLITGGLGADWLTGGGGNDTFIDTRAGLNNDTLVDFGEGDSIVFTDATLANFTFNLTGGTLTYAGGKLTLGTAPSLSLVASAYAGGGVQLTLQNTPLPRGLASAAGDFDGDGRSDVLLQNGTTGAIIVWRGQASGGLVESSGLAANALDASWRIAGIGDFNGDGRDDILWRHSSGAIGQWSGQAGQFANTSGVAANAIDNSWSVAAIADFNGDGRDDILWRHSGGEVGQWLANPSGSFANNGGAAANQVDPSWTVVASGDFNGDGQADILWRHQSGVYAEWQGSATGKLGNIGAVLAGATGAIVGSGDFNGDGREDILMRNATSGVLTNYLAQPGGQFTAVTPATQVTDLNWKIVAIGDYNGDGRDDLIWMHSSGVTAEWLATTNGQFVNNGGAMSVPAGWTAQSPDLWIV